MFKVKKINNKDVYYSDLIETEHFFTSRDIIAKDNLDLISSYLKIDKNNLYHPKQTHSSNIELVEDLKYDYPECDALILNKKNSAIYLSFADCTPVVIYDPKNNISAIAHAGWRGTASKIAPLTVLKMKKLFNTDPKDIIAVIGPCISFSEFETGTEVIDLLKKTINNTQGLFTNNHADLKEINKRQLEELGVKKFDICPYCTVKDNDKFFSYRKENKTKNRHSAFICIK